MQDQQHRSAHPQERHVVGGGVGATTVDRDHQGEADNDLHRSDHENKEHGDLATHIVEVGSEGDEGDIHPLSINSTHMNITSGLRRSAGPSHRRRTSGPTARGSKAGECKLGEDHDASSSTVSTWCSSLAPGANDGGHRRRLEIIELVSRRQ